MMRIRAALTRKTGTMLRAYQMNSSLCGWEVEGREGGREGGREEYECVHVIATNKTG
jgi:hypothetical protein